MFAQFAHLSHSFFPLGGGAGVGPDGVGGEGVGGGPGVSREQIKQSGGMGPGGEGVGPGGEGVGPGGEGVGPGGPGVHR